MTLRSWADLRAMVVRRSAPQPRLLAVVHRKRPPLTRYSARGARQNVRTIRGGGIKGCRVVGALTADTFGDAFNLRWTLTHPPHRCRLPGGAEGTPPTSGCGPLARSRSRPSPHCRRCAAMRTIAGCRRSRPPRWRDSRSERTIAARHPACHAPGRLRLLRRPALGPVDDLAVLPDGLAPERGPAHRTRRRRDRPSRPGAAGPPRRRRPRPGSHPGRTGLPGRRHRAGAPRHGSRRGGMHGGRRPACGR